MGEVNFKLQQEYLYKLFIVRLWEILKMKHLLLLLCGVVSFQSYAQQNVNKADSLKIELTKKNVQTDRIDLLNQIAKSYWSVNLDSAKNYFNKALIESKKVNYSKGLANAFNGIGVVYYYKGDIGKALFYYNRSLEIYTKIEDADGVTASLINIAGIKRAQGKLEEAYQDYKKAINNILNPGNHRLSATLNYNVGLVLMDMERFEEALIYMQKASQYSKNRNNKQYLGLSYNSMASIYSNLNFKENSLVYFNKAIDIFGVIGDNHNLYFAKINLAKTLGELERYKESEFIFNNTLVKTERSNYKFIKYYGYSSLGEVQIKLRKYQLAEKNLLKAYELSKESNDINFISRIEISLGQVYCQINRPKKAIQYVNKGMEKSLSVNNFFNLSYGYQTLHEIYKKNKNFEKALSSYTFYKNYQDSIFIRNREKIINDVKIKYETDVKESENELLRQDVAIKELKVNQQKSIRNFFILVLLLVTILAYVLYRRFIQKEKVAEAFEEKNKIINHQTIELISALNESKELNEELKIVNSTKDKLFGIISHDLINPFNTVIGYTELLKEDYESFSEEERKEIINIINRSSVRNYNLVRNLLDWSKTQQNRIVINKSVCDTKELITEAIDPYLTYAEKKGIKINYSIEYDTIESDKDVLKTVIGNLFYNAVKFTKPKGLVEIIFTKDKHGKLIKIKDQGIGISQDVLKDLFKIDKHVTTKGTNEEKGSGLGLIVCKEFMNLMGGNLTIDSKENHGTTINLKVA